MRSPFSIPALSTLTGSLLSGATSVRAAVTALSLKEGPAPRGLVSLVAASGEIVAHVVRENPLHRYRPEVVTLVSEGDESRFLGTTPDDIRSYDFGALPGYRVNRSLSECSDISEQAPFGRVERKVAQAIMQKRKSGDSAPLRFLSIGCGLGALELRLKEIFLDGIHIDSLSLTDLVPEDRRWAFHTLYLGNMDTVAWPKGYDLVVSFFGLFHTDDLPLALDRVDQSLVPGGEAFFNYRHSNSHAVGDWFQHSLNDHYEFQPSKDKQHTLFYIRK